MNYDDFDEWQQGHGSRNRGIFLGSIFRNSTGSESYLSFYDQWLITGKRMTDMNEGTDLRDWDLMTWQFVDKNQCGKRAAPWGILFSEL